MTLEIINVYSINLNKKDKRNKASRGNKCLVEEKFKNRKGSSLGVSDCTWRTRKLNLTSKEKFATKQLSCMVRQPKNSERFRHFMPHAQKLTQQ